MPAILALFGFLGALFAAGGGSSTTTTATTAAADDGAGDSGGDPSETPMDDGMDGDSPDMGGGHDGGHGGHDMPVSGSFTDITAFGVHHGTSSHTHHDSLEGGRTAITTEAMIAYNGLRDFLGLEATDIETIGAWAFEQGLTNNAEAYGDDIYGVGLYYGMQGAKVGWMRDDAFDPQAVADIQRIARLGEESDVMAMVETYGLEGFAEYLESEDLTDHFINTLKMEPHYGGWMHGRTHGFLQFEDDTGAPVAIAHDLNHLTVLSHDQTQPFMNDTFDWPQWPALDMPEADVANYFQSMVTLGDPKGEGIVEAAALTESLSALFIDVPDEPDPVPLEEEEALELF